MNDALDAVLHGDGAVLGRFGEIDLPVRFAGADAEWAAVRQRCGVLDGRFRALLRLIGGDRVSFLQGMVSNDVAALQRGQGTYAAFLTQQGKIVSDVRVYMLEDELWLDVPLARATAVREGLERYIIADDVEFGDTVSVPLSVIEGPLAGRVLVGVLGESLEGMAPYAHREVPFDGAGVRVTAVTHGGEPGYLVCGPPAVGATLWQRCRAAGAEPVGMDALDVLRIEAGLPWFGRDMDESTLISEVGLEAAISYRKGCYLGQEVVERVAARGQVQKKLVGLVCDGSQVPAPHAAVQHAGKEVGWVTSATWSPAAQAVIAMGYARREAWDPGAELTVQAAAGSVAARVVELPFYRRRP
jgi:folate-binding protein YgfZ